MSLGRSLGLHLPYTLLPSFLDLNQAWDLMRRTTQQSKDERSHLFQTPTPLLLLAWRCLLLLRLRNMLKRQLRLMFILRKLPSNSYQENSVYFASWGKIYVVVILPHEAKYVSWLFCLWWTTNGWSGHVTGTIQGDATYWGSELWLSLFFAQLICRPTATKSLPTLEIDVTISCVSHTFQTCHVFWTCHVITSNNCVAYSYWQNNFATHFASWGKIDTAYQRWVDCKIFQSESIPDPIKLYMIQSWSAKFLKIISVRSNPDSPI